MSLPNDPDSPLKQPFRKKFLAQMRAELAKHPFNPPKLSARDREIIRKRWQGQPRDDWHPPEQATSIVPLHTHPLPQHQHPYRHTEPQPSPPATKPKPTSAGGIQL